MILNSSARMLCLSVHNAFCIMLLSHSKLMHTRSETAVQKTSETLPNPHVPN